MKTENTKNGLAIVKLILLYIILASCSNVEYGAIVIKAHYIPPHINASLNTLTLPSNSSKVSISITGTDFKPIVKDFSVATNPSGATIDNIPAGENRTVSIDIKDPADAIIARGKTTGVRIKAGNVNNVDILITQVGVFSQLEFKVLPRAFAISSPLPDGKYMIFGGITEQYSSCGNGCVQFKATSETEMYDPKTGRFSQGPKMIEPRAFFTTNVLNNGDVVVIGGTDTVNLSCNITTCSIIIPPQSVKSSIEVYDPVSNSFYKTQSLTVPRAGHTTNIVENNLLIAGGTGISGPTNIAELVDIKTGKDILYPMVLPRAFQSGVTYQPDKVLLAGGNFTYDNIEIFQLSNGFLSYNNITWQTSFGSSIFIPVTKEIILNGGIGNKGEPSNSLVIINSIDEVFVGYREMRVPRAIFSDILLGDGTILAGGGITTAAFTTTTSAEIFNPALKSFVKESLLTTCRAGYAAQGLPDGSALLISGFININPLKGNIRFTDTAEIYNP